MCEWKAGPVESMSDTLCLVRELCGVAFTDKMLEENWCGERRERLGEWMVYCYWTGTSPLDSRKVGWASLWGATLDFGIPHTRGSSC